MIFELLLLVALACAAVMVPATVLALVVTLPGRLRVRTRTLLLVPAAALQGWAWSALLAGDVMLPAAVVLATGTTLTVGGARLHKSAHPAPPPPAWYRSPPQRF